jgi:hypothetical protein
MDENGLKNLTKEKMVVSHIRLCRIIIVDPDLQRQESVWQRKLLMVHITRMSRYFNRNLLIPD